MIKEVEKRLKIHFNNIEELKYLNKREKILTQRVENYKQDIKNCNIELTDTLKAIDYTSEYIQTNDTTSEMERMLMRETDKMLKEIKRTLKDKYLCILLKRDIEKQIIDFESVLSKTIVDNNDMELLKLYYGKFQLSDEMLVNRFSKYISRPTMYRKRIELLERISIVL